MDKDYKRLTKRGVNGRAYYATPFASNSMQEIYEEDVKKMQEVMERLCDLEDKIENGTLIELGYHIQKSYRNHDDQRYKIVLIDEIEIDGIGYDGLTKAEAEAKLRELEGARE